MSYSIVWTDGQEFNNSVEESKQLNYGKTKLIYPWKDWNIAIVHKDILTAMDNPDYTGNCPWKWTASAYSSALLFKKIEAKWVPISNIWIINSNTTCEKSLDMLPFEIIWRRYNVEWNSWEKRNPDIFKKGEKYPDIKYEVCLKWSVIAEDWEKIDDPFILLDDNFLPILKNDGTPRLTHPKKPNTEINYNHFVHANKEWIIEVDEVIDAMRLFKNFKSEILEIVMKVQETTLDTYSEIGRINADWKIEVWFYNKKWQLTLGDELELDSLRNMSPKKIEITSKNTIRTIEFWNDILWQNINDLIVEWNDNISKIIKANHSWKQVYRDLVKPWWNHQWQQRKIANDIAAGFVTNTIYLPVALALSERFWKEVWFILDIK